MSKYCHSCMPLFGEIKEVSSVLLLLLSLNLHEE